MHKIFLKIETATRRHLSHDNLSALQGVDIISIVSDDVLKDDAILEVWENNIKANFKKARKIQYRTSKGST